MQARDLGARLALDRRALQNAREGEIRQGRRDHVFRDRHRQETAGPPPVGRNEKHPRPDRGFRIGRAQLRAIDRDGAAAVEKAEKGRAQLLLAGIGKPRHTEDFAGANAKADARDAGRRQVFDRQRDLRFGA